MVKKVVVLRHPGSEPLAAASRLRGPAAAIDLRPARAGQRDTAEVAIYHQSRWVVWGFDGVWRRACIELLHRSSLGFAGAWAAVILEADGAESHGLKTSV